MFMDMYECMDVYVGTHACPSACGLCGLLYMPRVCVCVYVGRYECLCKYVWMCECPPDSVRLPGCVYVYVCLCVRINARLPACVCMYDCRPACLTVCVCVSVGKCVGMHICMHVVCVCESTKYVCVHVWLFRFRCVYGLFCVYAMYGWLPLCMCVYACMNSCLPAWMTLPVCMYARRSMCQ